jgi:MFS transporter, DHA2 family, multidrug resistance protein
MESEPIFNAATAASFEVAPESPQPHKWLVAAAVLLGAILTILDGSIVNVALPYMQRSFGVGVGRISWVVTSYLAAVSVMIPMSGWIAVRIGRRRYLLASVVLFVVASALCGLAQSIGEMVVFRVIQGAAGAAMMPLSQAILLETFPVEEHTLAMTTFGIGMMAAPVLGPTLGGWITQNWSWRWNFYINVPLGAFAALMVYAYVHDPSYLREQRGKGKVDYAGIVLIVAALGLSQIVLGRGGQDGWFAAPWVTYGAILSALLMVALVVHELRFPEPIVDLRMFGILGFSVAVVLISLQGLALWTVNLLNPLFLENVLHYDAWRAGLAVAPRGLGVVVALLVVGQLSRRQIEMRPIVCAGFVLGAYEAYRMSQWTVGVHEAQILLPIFLFGLGLGAIFPIVTALGIGQISRERMGFAASLFSVMINTGAAAGIAVATDLLTSGHARHRAQLLAAVPTPTLAGSPSQLLSVHTHLAGHAQILASLPAQLTSALESQAWLLAYNDVYRVTAVLLILLAPWAFLLKRAPVDTGTTIVPE